MATDLFHDVARAYYGVSAELYTLANIATHGNAPADYACESGSTQKYASYTKPELPPPIRQPRSTRGQLGLFEDIDVSPEAKQSADVSGASQTEGGESSNVARIIPGLEGILQPGDIQESLGEKWPEHVNHDEAWMSLDRERPSKSDPRAFRQWWDRNKRVNTYRKMMFHVMHPEHNPLEELDLKHTTGNGIAYSLNGPQSKPDFSETGTGGHVTADEEDYGIMDAAASVKPNVSATKANTVLPPPPLPKPRYPATKTLQKLGKSPPPPPPSTAERKRQESAGQQIAAEKKGGFAGQFNYSLPDEEIDYSITGTGDRFDDKYAAAVPPPPPPPPGKGTYGDLAKAAKQLQGTGVHLRDLLPSETTVAPTQASPASTAQKPATSKPQISDEMKKVAKSIQQRHNLQQKVPPSNRPWS
jgi:hypothetical protein